MNEKHGWAVYRGGTLYFDGAGWEMIKAIAGGTRKSPKSIVITGIKRGAKLEKAKNARN